MALWLGAVLAAWTNFTFVWNQFYREVPLLFDAGWCAYLVHQSAAILANPSAVAFASIGPIYYSTHFSPALWILSWPTWLLPVGPQVWFAALQALEHALLAVAVWCAVRRIAPQTKGSTTLAAAVLVALVAFNGIELSSIVYPHFEGWFVLFGFGFLLALFPGRTRLAAVPFAMALLLREDMGFHLAGVLLLTVLAAWWLRRRWNRELTTWLAFAGVGIGWSVVALLTMRTFFPGDDAFARVYLGDPPMAHLTWTEIADRLKFHASWRGYIWFPLGAYVVWSIVSRQWWVLLGYAAFVPWTLLNFIARSRAAGTISLYYSFPLGLALLWPLVGALAFRTRTGPGRETVGWVAAAVVLSIVGYLRDDGAREFARLAFVPATGTRPALESVTQRVAAQARDGNAVGVDDAVAALAPGDFKAGNLFGQTPPELTLAALYGNGRATRFGWELTRHLPWHYAADDTRLTVISREPLAWPHLQLVSGRAGSIRPFLRQTARELRESRRRSTDGLRLLCAGPKDWYFQVGETWTATFAVTVETSGPATVVCDVVTQHGAAPLVRDVVRVRPAPSGERHLTRELRFTIPEDQNTGIEVGVQVSAAATARVEDVVLRRVAAAPSSEATAMTEVAP
jgi:hypothetical protein